MQNAWALTCFCFNCVNLLTDTKSFFRRWSWSIQPPCTYNHYDRARQYSIYKMLATKSRCAHTLRGSSLHPNLLIIPPSPPCHTIPTSQLVLDCTSAYFNTQPIRKSKPLLLQLQPHSLLILRFSYLMVIPHFKASPSSRRVFKTTTLHTLPVGRCELEVSWRIIILGRY